MKDIKLLSNIVSEFSIADVGMEFLAQVPAEFYKDDLTSEQLDTLLGKVFMNMFGRNKNGFVPFIEALTSDYERLCVVYHPLIRAYAKSPGVSEGFRVSPMNRSYFYYTLSKHLSNRIVNAACEYLIYSPRDFNHEVDRLENLLTFILERWNTAKEKYSGNRVRAILEKSAIDTIYIPVGLILLWVYAELKEIAALSYNLPPPNVRELYLIFPFDPHQNEFRTNVADLNERLVKRFFNYYEYDKELVVHLILGAEEKLNTTSIENATLLEAADFKSRIEREIIRLLDLLFLKEFCKYPDLITYELLDDISFISRSQYQQQALIQKSIINEMPVMEKLVLLKMELQRLKISFSPIHLDSLSYNSCAEQFCTYLNQQKDLMEVKNSKSNLQESTSPLTSFRFNGNKQILKIVIDDLCDVISLLDERRTSRDYLMTLLTTADITFCDRIVALACETKQFNYIILRLAPFFENPLNVSIGDCHLFESKKKKIITTSNLRNTKNPSDVKEKMIIDRILKHLQ